MRYLMPALLAVAVLHGCDDDDSTVDAAPAADVAPETDGARAPDAAARSDAAPPTDAAPVVDAAPSPDAAPGDVVAATDYCERAVDVFCPYYVRCGRMAVADEAECRAVFVESCNAKYEPIYATHARNGELSLSRAGLAACAAHLEQVDCGAHNFDLDGPCSAVWTGLSGSGGTCGPGIGTFVCAEGTSCRLSVETFCGTCEPVVAVGQPCGDGARCGDDGQCVDGVCAARPAAGQPCAEDGPRCVAGTGCADGTCTIRPWAGPGEACGQAARCRYRSDCIDGVCVVGALQGQPCGAAQPCATGWCDGGTCATPKIGGVACASSGECVSGACVDGLCMEPRGPCFAQ